MGFGQKTAKQTVDQVSSNDPKLTCLDLTRSASFCMKALDNTLALCEALKKNTVITVVTLKECEIVDAGAKAIADLLLENHTIEELDLQSNKITTHGVILLSEGLARNKGVKTLNLCGQAQKELGEDCVERFITMFESNTTLTKIMWKVNSRRNWELSKLITRNVDIQRKIAGGSLPRDYVPVKGRTLSGLDSETVASRKASEVKDTTPAAPAPAPAPAAPAPASPPAAPAPAPASPPAAPAAEIAEPVVPAEPIPEPAVVKEAPSQEPEPKRGSTGDTKLDDSVESGVDAAPGGTETSPAKVEGDSSPKA